MKKKSHRFIALSYELYSIENDVETFVEKTEEMRPMQFFTDCNMVLEAFEKAVLDKPEGEDFECLLTKEEAYGEYNIESVLTLNKGVFSPNGEFDAENVYEGAVIPLQNEHGNRFIARILEITDETVKADLNHPLAGKALKFKVHILENREASNEEVEQFFESMKSHNCGCGGGGCCGEGDGESCGCGDHKEESGCCGGGCSCK